MKPEDKKLLEYAAKACGIEQTGYFEVIGVQYVNGSEDSPYTDFFNPLTNNSDCAAMCAKLEIDTYWLHTNWKVTSVECGVKQVLEEQLLKDYNDREAAWRYAATMVAAKIGWINGD
jgi:hypothetical protein